MQRANIVCTDIFRDKLMHRLEFYEAQGLVLKDSTQLTYLNQLVVDLERWDVIDDDYPSSELVLACILIVSNNRLFRGFKNVIGPDGVITNPFYERGDTRILTVSENSFFSYELREYGKGDLEVIHNMRFGFFINFLDYVREFVRFYLSNFPDGQDMSLNRFIRSVNLFNIG